jgi:hypothetical protein
MVLRTASGAMHRHLNNNTPVNTEVHDHLCHTLCPGNWDLYSCSNQESPFDGQGVISLLFSMLVG